MAKNDRTEIHRDLDVNRLAAGPAGCLIVGVGASAGGLDAFRRLLKQLPPDEGLALVYVQHLDPTHESALPELLARHAHVPVEAVHDETPVEPGRVYVIPPNASLTVQSGVLRLSPRVSEADFGKPIDRFLMSLAEDQGDRAIGVILSGTGSDGTAGLRAIKQQGGVTIAQTPDSASYDSMPRAAITAGLVDYILSPEDIASRLVEQVSQVANPFIEMPGEGRPPVEETLRKICDVLRRKTGHDFSPYKRNTLLRRLGRRMGALEMTSPARYLQYLQEEAKEADALLREMLIGVTGFFRDAEAFEALTQYVLPGLFEARGERDHLRAWVVGCASGEEVYSLAMLLAEEAARRPAPPRIQIFATDIDGENLAVARQGRYPESACADVSPERLERFFTHDAGSYRVRKELRQLCVFSAHNVLRDPPFPDLDLVSCRNVLIYIDTAAQGKVIALFHHALRSDGALLLGTAENIAGRTDLFEPLARGHRIYKRVDAVKNSAIDFPIAWAPGRDSSAPRSAAPAGGPDAALRRNLERAILEQVAPAGMIVRDTGDVVYLFGPAAKYLGPSPGTPSLNAYTLLEKGLRSEFRHALQTVVRTKEPVTTECRLGDGAEGEEALRVALRVRQLSEVDPAGILYLVVFQDLPAAAVLPADAAPSDTESVSRHMQVELRDAREQLQMTVDELEAANQELQSSNEELLSMNEELQSGNEELQSSKEEVQTVNSELEAVNRELARKVEELDTAKTDLETLFEGAQVATVFLDNDLLIKRFTPTATEVFRLREGDVGRPVTDITARFTDGDVGAKIHEVLRTLQRQEITVARSDDGTRYLMRILPYRTRQNVIDGAVVTFVDITDLKQAQEALEQADRRKDDFLAMLSHELRNPLAVLASSIHVWQAQDVGDPQVARARDLACRQLAHTARLLDELLDRARILRGTIQLRRRPLDLRELLKDVVDTSRATDNEQHHISLSVPAYALAIEGDSDRLAQVFGNLLHNAQKYTPSGGHIDVTASGIDDEVVVGVRDDGAGIPGTLLPHVFDSFGYSRGEVAGVKGGLGLGLTLVRHLVTRHGGSVEARSDPEGNKGSEFIVRLPRCRTEIVTDRAPARAEGATAGPARRVLVVDDNSDVAELLALQLQMDGHEVTIANDGPAALRAAVDFRPDAVLLDLGLPGMDGYEIARQIRLAPNLARSVLIAVTGYGGDEHVRHSREAGIDHHLVKPLDADRLKQILREL